MNTTNFSSRITPSRIFFILNGKILGNLDYNEFMRDVEEIVYLKEKVNTSESLIRKNEFLFELGKYHLPPEKALIAYVYANKQPLKLTLTSLTIKKLVEHIEKRVATCKDHLDLSFLN